MGAEEKWQLHLMARCGRVRSWQITFPTQYLERTCQIDKESQQFCDVCNTNTVLGLRRLQNWGFKKAYWNIKHFGLSRANYIFFFKFHTENSLGFQVGKHPLLQFLVKRLCSTLIITCIANTATPLQILYQISNILLNFW